MLRMHKAKESADGLNLALIFSALVAFLLLSVVTICERIEPAAKVNMHLMFRQSMLQHSKHTMRALARMTRTVNSSLSTRQTMSSV